MKIKFLLLLIVYTSICNAQIINIPDANFKIKLLGANTTNLIAKDLSGNYFKIDANNDGEIQQSEANNVSELNLNYPLNGTNYYMNSAVGVTNFVNLTKLDLRSNRIVNLNISGMQFLNYIDCSNNNQYLISLTIENLPLLETLYCQNAGSNTSTPYYSFSNLNSLKNINFGGCKFYSDTLDDITTLENMYGYGGLQSGVTSLNLSNKPNLKIVELDSNALTNLILMPNNSIETLKLYGNSLTSFDKTLFTNLKILYLNWNKLNSLDVSNMSSLIELNCDNANTNASSYLTSLNVQGCTNLNKLVCSRNLLTNLNLTNLSNLTHLDCYGNHNTLTGIGLQTISLQNCSSLKIVIVHANPLITELDLSCSNNYTQIRVQNCTNLQRINLKNGANESSMSAGLFSSYSCPNLNLVTVDFNENFSFLASTIQQSPYYNFTPNCRYNTVLGNVKFDIEGDGCQNNNGIQGIKIHYNCSTPDCYTFSDSFGNFTLYTQSNTITITPENNLFSLFDFGLTGPVVFNFSPNNILENLDLCLAPAGIHNDLEISIIPITNAVSGFEAEYKIIYKNKGNQIEFGTINLAFDDSRMDLININPLPAITSTNNLQWNFTNFLPFETREINFTADINSASDTPPVNIGDVLNYTTSINGSLLDATPNDNNAYLNQTVLSSFDPNNKICLEGNNVSQSVLGEYVHYIINFENNGTANAQNIVVRDLLDVTKFDVNTLEPISSSHNVYSRVTNINEAEFIFENINLPFDDANNDGYIAFKIKTKSNLSIGDSFSNNASIYFDYNYPILTNTFTSTIQVLHNNNYDKNVGFLFYPNPIKEVLTFKTNKKINKIDIFDLTGRKILSKEVIENIVNLNELNKGNYLAILALEDELINIKITKD